MNSKRKIEKNNMIFTTGVLFAFFLIALIIFGKHIFSYAFSGKTKDANQIIASGEELKKGDVVTLKIYYLTSAYAESKGNFKTKQSAYHYIAWLEDGSLISISAHDYDTIQKFNNFSNEIYNYSFGKTNTAPAPITITGELHKIDSKIKQFYNEQVDAAKYTFNPNTMNMEKDESKFSKVYDLEIDTNYSRTAMTFLSIVIIALTILSGVAFIYTLLFYDKASNNPTEQHVSGAYNNTTSNNIENDPIFNKSFYNTYNSKKSENTIIEKDNNSESYFKSDNSDDSIDNDYKTDNEPKSTGSKFKLKDID